MSRFTLGFRQPVMDGFIMLTTVVAEVAVLNVWRLHHASVLFNIEICVGKIIQSYRTCMLPNCKNSLFSIFVLFCVCSFFLFVLSK